MLKAIESFKKLASKTFRANNNKVVDSINRTNKIIMNLSKNLTYMPNIGAIEELIFLTPDVEKTSNYLRQTFIKALIFQHFHLKSYI